MSHKCFEMYNEQLGFINGCFGLGRLKPVPKKHNEQLYC